jgi:hypothetical protein
MLTNWNLEETLNDFFNMWFYWLPSTIWLLLHIAVVLLILFVFLLDAYRLIKAGLDPEIRGFLQEAINETKVKPRWHEYPFLLLLGLTKKETLDQVKKNGEKLRERI